MTEEIEGIEEWIALIVGWLRIGRIIGVGVSSCVLIDIIDFERGVVIVLIDSLDDF